jgi:5-methyltetrahydrofolate--homocysteine methyltransferase
MGIIAAEWLLAPRAAKACSMTRPEPNSMPNRFLQLLDERPWLLADGATGTNLFAAGLQSGDAPELWNVSHSEHIAALHRSFIEAGADIVLSNTFGGNRYRLKLHQAQARVAELNEAAARIARKEADAAERTVVVAGSMGPTGELFQPLGPLSAEDGRDAFAEQARALASGGVDVLWIETMSAQQEIEAALAGAAETGLPVVCTCSFDTHGRTMMGITPAELAALCEHSPARPAAFGANCGVGAAELVAVMLSMSQAAASESVLVAKANCGVPHWEHDAIRYDGTPPLMADYARLVLDSGARIIGGCCGTTAEHLRAMRASLEAYDRCPRPDLATVQERLGTVTRGAAGQGPAAGGGARRGSRRTRRAD